MQVIESNASAIQVLEPLAEEIRVLMEQDGSPAWNYRLDPQTLSAVHLKAIGRIYGLFPAFDTSVVLLPLSRFFVYT